jgi:hypothetical protein
MANFEVNPIPYVPVGFDLEQWARPARGRLVVAGDPHRRHEQWAIVTMNPPPQQLVQHVLQAIDDVVDYFQDQHMVQVRSACASPLWLCLLEFRNAVARQTMINLSPLVMHDGRELVVQEHDNGLNQRACPFSRTCWIMLLCFPLDYQSRGYIDQAVSSFGTVLTVPNNDHCKSRVLVRCSVLHPTRIPRSLLVCRPPIVGGNGASWTVPVFLLNSQNNEVLLGDEEPIPPDGNLHPFPGNHANEAQQDWFDNVEDLAEVQQANLDEGWEPLVANAAPAAAVQNNDWEPWPQQDEEAVAENEIQQMQLLADQLLQQAVLNHNENQVSESVSSGILDYYRAQGQPIRFELPLIQDRQAIVSMTDETSEVESDYPIYRMAAALNLHQCIGPMPSAEMILQDIVRVSMTSSAGQYLPRSVTQGLLQFPYLHNLQSYITLQLGLGFPKLPANIQRQIRLGKQPLIVPNNPVYNNNMSYLLWGNNIEASSSGGHKLYKSSDFVAASEASPEEIAQQQNDKKAIAAIASEMQREGLLNTSFSFPQMDLKDWELLKSVYLPSPNRQSPPEAILSASNNHALVPASVPDIPSSQVPESPEHYWPASEEGVPKAADSSQETFHFVVPLQAIPPAPKKRTSRKRPTPVVDDEVKRSARLNRHEGYEHMELDEKNKPRKLFKEDTIKLQKKLHQTLETSVSENAMVPIQVMQDLAVQFCDVAPEEIADELLLRERSEDRD